MRLDDVVGEPVGGREGFRRQTLGVAERGRSQQKDQRQLDDLGARHNGRIVYVDAA